MTTLFINDGYTRELLIPAGKAHGETWIVFRPLLAAERRRLALQTVRLHRHGEAGSTVAAQLVAASLARRIVSWELFDDQGSMLPITSATLLKLDRELFRQIYEGVAEFADEESSAKN